MLIFKKKSDLQAWLAGSRPASIGFVPTMGALHPGHISLLRQASAECEAVVCSIFVNPTQFNDPADLASYPRPIAADIEMLLQAGCQALYMPDYADLYPNDTLLATDLGGLDSLWEGARRPGHFAGVVTVVKHLLDAVKPTHTFFGQKDYQQCCVVQKLIRNLGLDVKFVMCPIMRDADGLAMSSRNIRLSAPEREKALMLNRLLSQVPALKLQLSPEAMANWFAEQLTVAGLEVEYATVADATDLKPVDSWKRPAVVLLAVKLPSVRLIDNVLTG